MPEQSAETNQYIWGAAEIATLIGKSTRATFHLLEKGELPAKKVGGRWVTSRGQIEKHFEDQTRSD